MNTVLALSMDYVCWHSLSYEYFCNMLTLDSKLILMILG